MSNFTAGKESLCGSCYKLFTVPETWSNAQAKCRSVGAQLVKIESAVENDFLTRTFPKATGSLGVTYWIGLSDQVEEGKWTWTDESILGNYTNWGRDNPNDLSGNQNCGHMVIGNGFSLGSLYFTGYNDGEWNDLRCDYPLAFICEKVSY
ncbi:hypothetical protein OS493_033098 [Desmophyllum pertusum]|uniref:C-type lectin domain-containing protein n=1 Tax=Desmophyllum pertusum TaxID=174260 RepID=A0A9X0CQB4_9CNID|nr:hypothetical protein OS493_033098 [Desmophyllum pertusum]